MELLPPTPSWDCIQLRDQPGYVSKKPMFLYMRNAIECVEYLFRNPLFADRMDLVPRRLWETAERLNRVYGEWSTGDHIWNLQVCTFSIPVE